MTKRALLLINRHARKGRNSFAHAVDVLNDLGFELITVPVKRPEYMPQVVRRHRDSIDLVIVGGGDGTLNAIVDSLVDMKLPLGILPLGTANDLARTLKIPLAVESACRVIAQGQLKYIDLGCVNGKHFFNVASLGLSVEITGKLSKGAKRRWGVLSYAMTALQVIGQTRPFNAEIVVNDKSVRVKTIQIAVGNGRFYGGGMAIAKDATIDDQRLDLYSLELNYWWQIFPLLWRLPQGQHGVLPWVRTIEGETMEIYTRKSHSINTDGEITSKTPAAFRVVSHALGVLVPL
ncbi:MAG: lipid kinase [cyanobacterium endosymbiont of Epithemia adnata isolate EadnSB Bon19]|jgi:YegS/Rv2252/BmrU family lipid kinase|uniref:lipid kinase n=1 Tax=cyanobacterium endosymbiont of Epithemia turgida TaxID=718217 RepID=UPI0004D1EE49|nr:lipid kinase [cyanobacterium endosymbiont of Epithemia turgida]BAP18118.1 diacylglycerol kinase catalytic subunit [cyanobacterium endosymbiont of Epithemia turgida isolate EtSB Lake Yunoko]